jgi:hypothetical protein
MHKMFVMMFTFFMIWINGCDRMGLQPVFGLEDANKSIARLRIPLPDGWASFSDTVAWLTNSRGVNGRRQATGLSPVSIHGVGNEALSFEVAI